MPLVQTRGAASAQGFGEFAQAAAAAAVNYIEDVFSTFLYTGNGSTQTITNNIDLSTEGGLVWIKARTNTSGGATSHALVDSARGTSKWLSSDATSAEATNANLVTGFTTSGFSVGNTAYFANENTIPYVSWTFREQPKFFDVVTYTGNGANRTIAHNLGSVPGCIIIKDTSAVSNWYVYHRSLATNQALKLNSTATIETSTTFWNNTAATSSVFSLGTAGDVNGNGDSFVAYIFAHDAGGFGLTGTDNVISCGIFTSDASGGCNVNLGYEPQWILSKSSTIAVPWAINDTMRGFTSNNTNNSNLLYANYSYAESLDSYLEPTSTGFKSSNQLQASAPYIYIAIRRGPMKVPTLGTSVYNSGTRGTAEATAAGVKYYSGFPVDFVFTCNRAFAGHDTAVYDRLRGVPNLFTNLTTEEGTGGTFLLASNLGFDTGTISANLNQSAWMFRRAPGFFDEVCDTGTGSAHTITHNLGVVPELMIRKKRSAADNWIVYANNDPTDYLILNTTAATADLDTMWNDTAPTSTVFTVGTNDDVNQNTGTFVTYLFSTAAGVSKVGSYTGTGTTLQINCGFTGGARFVLIKRTDDTGDWYFWDSARGIVAGNDPYLLLNSTAAEVTSTDYVDTYSAGFEISSTAPAAINASAGSFIFLAIA